ncbi:MAG: helix-turn-helix transcriptional regulator [Candidatus Nitrotoga sp.]
MTAFSAMLREVKSKDSYWVEAAKLDFALELTRHMNVQSVSKADMAKRLGTSPAYITKLLRGDTNLTIESMVKASRALGCDFHTHVAHRNAAVKWFEVYTNESQVSRPNPEALRWAKFVKEPHREPVPVAA